MFTKTTQPYLTGVDWEKLPKTYVINRNGALDLRLPRLIRLSEFSQAPNLRFYSKAGAFIPEVAASCESFMDPRRGEDAVSALRRNLQTDPLDCLRVVSRAISHKQENIDSVVPALITLMSDPQVKTGQRERFMHALKGFAAEMRASEKLTDELYGSLSKMNVNPRTAHHMARSIKLYFHLLEEEAKLSL